jgi:hypothetical protein
MSARRRVEPAAACTKGGLDLGQPMTSVRKEPLASAKRTRKKLTPSAEAGVLVQSRRRCCVCFGLSRDDGIKTGQIAHLDHDRSNNQEGNLAFMCMPHHDQYDSITSQSKGLKLVEVEQYRAELLAHFGTWSTVQNREHLLNFLSYRIGLDEMADAAIEAGGAAVFYGIQQAFDVLTTDEFDSCDGDLWMPHLMTCEAMASWGWLTFTTKWRRPKGEMQRLHITVKRQPICDAVARHIYAREVKAGSDVSWLTRIANARDWNLPTTDVRGQPLPAPVNAEG